MTKPFPAPPSRTCIPSEATKRKQVEILRMRREGMSFPQIAKHYGETQGYIHKLYRKALKDIIVEEVDEVRRIEIARLDELYQAAQAVLQQVHPLVSGGAVVRDTVDDENGQPILDENKNPITARLQDVGPKLAALDRALKVMERRAKLLGLDMPTKTAITDPTGEKEATPFVQFYLPANGRDQDGAEDSTTPEQ